MKPNILVVDDSDIQRQWIGGLLKSKCDYEICFAWDGQDAYDYLRKSSVDLVLTDLVMPGIDGLALIRSLRRTHPDIAVALVTDHGNEDIARAALYSGAVHYIPKAELSDRLAPTVKQIIHRVHFDQQRSHATRRVDRVTLVESIASDPDLVVPLVDLVHEELLAAGAGDRTTRIKACIALEEALTNSILHGNLEMTRQDMTTARTKEAEQALERIIHRRMAEPHLATRRVKLHAEISADTANFIVRDEGTRFSGYPDLTKPDNDFLQRGHARGLMLMRSLVDELAFNPAVNEVRLSAKLSPSTHHQR